MPTLKTTIFSIALSVFIITCASAQVYPILSQVFSWAPLFMISIFSPILGKKLVSSFIIIQSTYVILISVPGVYYINDAINSAFGAELFWWTTPMFFITIPIANLFFYWVISLIIKHYRIRERVGIVSNN